MPLLLTQEGIEARWKEEVGKEDGKPKLPAAAGRQIAEEVFNFQKKFPLDPAVRSLSKYHTSIYINISLPARTMSSNHQNQQSDKGWTTTSSGTNSQGEPSTTVPPLDEAENLFSLDLGNHYDSRDYGANSGSNAGNAYHCELSGCYVFARRWSELE